MVISRLNKYTKADGVKGNSIWIVNTDGSKKRLIAERGAWGARWSSDGKSLVFYGGVDENGKKVSSKCLRLYHLETDRATTVFSEKDSPFKKLGFHFEWAKNKRSVAFAGIKKDGNQFVSATIDVDVGLDSLQLFDSPLVAHSLCYDYHPDGDSLLVTGIENGKPMPVSLGLTDNAKTQFIPNVPANIGVRDTCYTPDGKHIIAALGSFGPVDVPTKEHSREHQNDSSANQQMQKVNCGGVCVRNDDYRRIADAIVRLFLYRKSDAEFVLAKTTTTDERGRFSIQGTVPAEFDLGVSRIAISSTGRATTVMPYQESAKNAQPIQLAAPNSITGRVTDEDSWPVEGANVIYGYLPGVWQVRTDSDGRFEIADVPSEEGLRPKGFDLVMASHPKSDSLLTTVTINRVPTSVNLKLTDVPNVPSYLARSAERRLADAAQAIQGTWQTKNEMTGKFGDDFSKPGLTITFNAGNLQVHERKSRTRLAVHEMGYRLLPDSKIAFDTERKIFGSTISYMLMGDELWLALPRDGSDGETFFDYSSLSRVDGADVGVATPDDQSSALVILTDPAEFENGNALQQLVARIAMEQLSEDDLLGLLNPAKDGEQWLWVGRQGLTAIGDKGLGFKNAIANATLGNSPTFDPALKMALDGYAAIEAKNKQLIIMTDGEPSLKDKTLLKKFHDAGIRISILLSDASFYKHDAKMKEFSEVTGGKLYRVKRHRRDVLKNILQREMRASAVREGRP